MSSRRPGPSRHNRQECRFDRWSGQVQGTHLIPVRAGAAEALGGDTGAFGQNPGSLPTVSLQRRVVGWETGNKFTGQCAIVTLRKRKPNIGAFPHPVQQPALAQQFQMPGEARLRLAQNLGELHDAEGTPGSQRKKTQAGRFSGGAQTGEEVLHGECPMT